MAKVDKDKGFKSEVQRDKDMFPEVDAQADVPKVEGPRWCPRCGAIRGKVTKTVPQDNCIVRYRKCVNCGFNFTTKEKRA